MEFQITNTAYCFYHILDQIEMRPALYLHNDYSFSTLYGFISGYKLASGHPLPIREEFNDFDKFSNWLLGHLNIGSSSMGWYYHISSRNKNNDEKSFEEFFHYLNIFKRAKIRHQKFNIKPSKD